jgi:hypothetical protein
MTKELIVRTPTQAIYDAVVARAGAEGQLPMSENRWPEYKENTCVNVSEYCTCYSSEDFYRGYPPKYEIIDAKDYLKERSMENLQAGDILVNDDCNYAREVQGVIGKAVITTTSDDQSSILNSIQNLIDSGWKLEDSEPKVTELTLDQVAEKFKIPVKELRIKE